jgi:hypothetical protein
VRVTTTLAGWLYTVARNVALKAVKQRRRKPRPLDGVAVVAGRQEEADAERAAALYAEIARLPERYRVPVVLCHLTGLSQKEAAAQLGLNESAVSKRLDRALDKLRAGLERRGIGRQVADSPGSFGSNGGGCSPTIAAVVRRRSSRGTTTLLTRRVVCRGGSNGERSEG